MSKYEIAYHSYQERRVLFHTVRAPTITKALFSFFDAKGNANEVIAIRKL